MADTTPTPVAALARFAPVHLRRDTLRAVTPSSQEALNIVHMIALSEARDLCKRLGLAYFDHAFESSQQGDYENIVLPDAVFTAYRRDFIAAGFTVAPDLRQFASADGLEEALKSGADLNKRWD